MKKPSQLLKKSEVPYSKADEIVKGKPMSLISFDPETCVKEELCQQACPGNLNEWAISKTFI